MLSSTYDKKRSLEYTCGHFQNSTNVFCRCEMAKSGRNGTQCSTHSINNEQIGISGRRESKSFCQRKNDDAIGKLVFPPLPPPPMSLPKQITSRISVEGWAFNQIYMSLSFIRMYLQQDRGTSNRQRYFFIPAIVYHVTD